MCILDHQVSEGSDGGDKEGSVIESQADLAYRTTAPSQASTLMNTSLDKATGLTGEGTDNKDKDDILHGPKVEFPNT